jgi:hypothetical protein
LFQKEKNLKFRRERNEKIQKGLICISCYVLISTLVPTSVLWVHATDTEINLIGFVFTENNGGTGWTYNQTNRTFAITQNGVTVTGTASLASVQGITFNVASGFTITSDAVITNVTNGITIGNGGTFNMTGGSITGATTQTATNLVTLTGNTTLKISAARTPHRQRPYAVKIRTTADEPSASMQAASWK